MTRWGGRKVKHLTALVLATKGTECHLCGLPGADSPDHEPPRHDLVAAGVPDPDNIRYLFPSHRRPCNLARGRRPITPQLRDEMRDKRLAAIGAGPSSTLSPSLAARRPQFFETANTPEGSPSRVIYRDGGENRGTEE